MKKSIIILMALLFIALPNSIAYFDGQHNFTTKSCNDCHIDIDADFFAGTAMNAFSCETCHNYYSSTSNGHAATNSENRCNNIDCHPNVKEHITQVNESHRNIYQSAISNNSRFYANEACFFCHSDMSNSMVFYRPELIKYEITANWEIQNFSVGNSMRYDVLLDRNNGFHAILGGNDVFCTDCHTDIQGAIDEYGHFPAYNKFHTTTSSCSLCHNNLNQGTQNQHASKISSCIDDCHEGDASKHNETLFNAINAYESRYQGNICFGCHNSRRGYDPTNNNVSMFTVFFEPRSDVLLEII